MALAAQKTQQTADGGKMDTTLLTNPNVKPAMAARPGEAPKMTHRESVGIVARVAGRHGNANVIVGDRDGAVLDGGEEGLGDLRVGHHFAQTVRTQQQAVARFDRPLSLIMADLDLLREINNTYGHLAGDAVLKGIAEVFRAAGALICLGRWLHRVPT